MIPEPVDDQATKPAEPVETSPITNNGDSAAGVGSTKVDPPKKKPHPIDDLIAQAEKEFSALLAKETKTLNEAAAAYRKRRGRHPPPGFATWYQFAIDLNATIVEDFFDPIYDDLNPFWGLSPSSIRREAHRYEMTINVRNGKASARSDWFWTMTSASEIWSTSRTCRMCLIAATVSGSMVSALVTTMSG